MWVCVSFNEMMMGLLWFPQWSMVDIYVTLFKGKNLLRYFCTFANSINDDERKHQGKEVRWRDGQND